MFDAPGMKERYATLVAWNGLWVNYWTETLPRRKEDGVVVIEGVSEKDTHEERDRVNDVALLETGMAGPSADAEQDTGTDVLSGLQEMPPTLDQRTQSEIKMETKAAEKAEKARLKEQKAANKALKKQREAELKARKKGIVPPRHFIVLPTGLGRALGGSDKWETVVIGGVQDEVAAHCGLFIRGQNLDYDGLVERVGKKVLTWCETIR
jgi:hypothetical protein